MVAEAIGGNPVSSLVLAPARPAVRLYVGAQVGQVQGERNTLEGDMMFTAAHSPRKSGLPAAPTCALLDSGAFTDPPHRRLTPERALERQLAWEVTASEKWGQSWQAMGLVSYDLLIDETWVAGQRHKRRWTVGDADWAVTETVAAARYLSSQRHRLGSRIPILSCQGVDAIQYSACASEVLALCERGDWLGLGGWCIIGRQKSLLPTFWQTLWRVIPQVAASNVSHVHIFGVLWEPALAGLAWMADQFDVTISTDSTAPVLACTWKGGPERSKRAGVRRPYWKDNVEWWRAKVATLRVSPYYQRPPRTEPARQLSLWG